MAAKQTTKTTKTSKTKSPPKTRPKAKNSSAKTGQRKPAAKKAASASGKSSAAMQQYIKRSRFIRGIILVCTAILFTLLYFMEGEKIWKSLHECYKGIFGFFGFLVPILLIYCAVQMFREQSTYRFPLKVFFFSGTIFMLATVIYTFSSSGMELGDYGTELVNCYQGGYLYHGAGFIGGLLGIPLAKFFGSVAGGLLASIILIVFLYMSFEALIISLSGKISAPVSERLSDRREIKTKVREETRKIKSESRQRVREEYVSRKVSEKVDAAKKKTADSEYRRIHKTPIYEPERSHSAVSSGVMTPVPTVHDEPEEDFFINVTTPKPKRTSPAPAPAPYSAPSPAPVPPAPAETLFVPTPPPDKAEKTDRSKPAESRKPAHDTIDIAELLKTDSRTDTPAADSKGTSPVQLKKPSPTAEPTPAKPTAPTAAEPKTAPSANPNPIVEGHYIKPPFILLEPPNDEVDENISQELHQTATKLVDTLKSFGVQTTIMNISRGPSVTRYELQPAAGVKISKITNLADDITMHLAAMGVRIEAPIPGKNAVGIEVPNQHVTTVKMRSLVESADFQTAKSKLTVALGKDITGNITLADLSKMPHLLIAGSTGSGKSVCINAMIISLLYKANPEEVKLMLIDPKVVELGVYNGIPHLLVPVVTDPRKAAGALNWAVNEMLERYKTFAEYNVRDIHSYNRLVDKQNAEMDEIEPDEEERSLEEEKMLAQAQAEIEQTDEAPQEQHKLEKMAQVVIIIDELADLMMAAPNEVEEAICRLAQMARAAGMYLVIATQRPSVDVITGLIKANVPSRIAFAVKSQIDSRTILDGSGAEKLLGKGDMLFSPIGTTKPVRVQGCFVNDDEIEGIINFIKNNKAVEYDKHIMDEIDSRAVGEAGAKPPEAAETGDTDPMMEQAIQCVVEAGQASTSLLQRRLRLGYARAGRLIDEMEQMGIVGPHEGSKPRQVLMTYQQWLERNLNTQDTE